MFPYQKLDIYKLAKELVKEIYIITNNFPKSEEFGLKSQMNRAVISIPSNIAEGNGRNSKKDNSRFISIAYGSLMELSCQIDIAHDLDFIEKEKLEEILKKCRDLSVRLNNYRQWLNNDG